MDIYVIPPVSELKLMNLGDRYFCLAQQYRKHESYRQFFKQKVAEGKWVTLDNGVGDHDFISQDELFEIMKDLMPSEVIPLDVLFDGGATYLNAVDFIARLKREELVTKIAIFVCPQGNTFTEWINCYIKLSELEEVQTIGMSKLAIPWVVSRSTRDTNIARDRNVMFDYLQNEGLLKKQLHFLGAGEPWEFEHYKDCSFVRSTDSCFTILSGICGIRFDSSYKRTPTPRNYFDRKITAEQMVLVKENISTFKQLLHTI